MYWVSDGGRREIEPGPSADNDNKEYQWDSKEAEAKDEEEGFGSNGEQETTPLLYSTRKRSLSTAGEKSHARRRIKCCRFSSPLSSDEETETGAESDSSSYTPSKPHHSSRPTGLEDTSDTGKIGFAGGQCRTAVIYKQQSWKGEIIKERNEKQGRGRPRKQHLTRWNPSWVDGAHLTAPELLQNWKEEKALKGRR